MQRIVQAGVDLGSLTELHRVMRMSSFPHTPNKLSEAIGDLLRGRWWFIEHNNRKVGFFGMTDTSQNGTGGFNIGCIPSFRGRWAKGTVVEMVVACFDHPDDISYLYMESEDPAVEELALRLGFVLSYTNPEGKSFYTLNRNQYKKWRH